MDLHSQHQGHLEQDELQLTDTCEEGKKGGESCVSGVCLCVSGVCV